MALIRPGVRAGWERPVAVLVVAIVAVTSFASWIAYLLFCRFLVLHTNDPASLRHAAAAARAFRSGVPSALVQAAARIAALLRPRA